MQGNGWSAKLGSSRTYALRKIAREGTSGVELGSIIRVVIMEPGRDDREVSPELFCERRRRWRVPRAPGRACVRPCVTMCVCLRACMCLRAARELDKLRALVALRGEDVSAAPAPSAVLRAKQEAGKAAAPPPTARSHYSTSEEKPAAKPDRLRRAQVRA